MQKTPYQETVFVTRYARWDYQNGRRETWDETVDRYNNYIFRKAGVVHPQLQSQIRDAIYNMQIMPSMRAFMTAGPALDISNVAGFNCSYITIDSPRAFDELLYILMCGTGVGFSVERRYVEQLPTVPSLFHTGLGDIIVEDSKIGWALAIQELIRDLYAGTRRKLDTHKVRPAGAILKTFGGRASGPEPLVEVAEYITNKFRNAAGRKLKPIECHDICCKIAACVVVGGVRRSALISLSDLDDEEMRHAKAGQWWERAPERALANNSAVYEGPLDRKHFDVEWKALVESGSGERGIFNRTAARKAAAAQGRDPHAEYGTNPCGEIILLPNEFCNLTEVVARATDAVQELKSKVEMATVLGTFQSTLTDFDYLRPIWKENCDLERLLGVSITGIYDCPQLHDAALLRELRALARATNEEWAAKLGINPSASITCVKPSGTVSQLVNAASGIHPRHAKFYIRRIRNDSKDPVTVFLTELGFPVEVDFYNPEARVFSFPIRAPEGTLTREDVDPISHLETWLLFKQNWCEHNPSVTINVAPDQWDMVADWVYEHFEEVCGLSFLPYDGGTYTQAPYEEIDEAQFLELEAKMPKNICWSDLSYYENDGADIVAGRELSCAGGQCDI